MKVSLLFRYSSFNNNLIQGILYTFRSIKSDHLSSKILLINLTVIKST